MFDLVKPVTLSLLTHLNFKENMNKFSLFCYAYLLRLLAPSQLRSFTFLSHLSVFLFSQELVTIMGILV